MLQIFNSLSKQKELFVPIEPGKVRMYVCGMTVYDYCHLGHARVLVVFDVITRYLRAQGYEVNYVRNITDIDDKIVVRAQENGEDIYALTTRFIQAMHEDCVALSVLPPNQEPRATQSIDWIIELITTLERKGFTYKTDKGDVYYSVARFKNYGKLSGRKLEDQIAGHRVEVDTEKLKAEDFVLWKHALPNEPQWPSPWGAGRPGWHIECSAMATHCLGEHFDIHGGGMDLKFPHHENEIAQTEAATGKTAVNYWVHNGFVNIDQKKMSKSEKNFFTVREVLGKYQAEVIRFFILNSHYRGPLNYSEENLLLARTAVNSLYTALRSVTPKEDSAAVEITEYRKRFMSAMDDDFNTADAIAVLFELSHALNKAKVHHPAQKGPLAAVMRELGAILGLLQEDTEHYFKQDRAVKEGALSAEAIDVLIAQRIEARKNRDFAAADRIRDQLVKEGIILEDSTQGTLWRRS